MQAFSLLVFGLHFDPGRCPGLGYLRLSAWAFCTNSVFPDGCCIPYKRLKPESRQHLETDKQKNRTTE